jgi:hypothetical protein
MHVVVSRKATTVASERKDSWLNVDMQRTVRTIGAEGHNGTTVTV